MKTVGKNSYRGEKERRPSVVVEAAVAAVPSKILANAEPATSHKQILKATGILGGAQVIEILFRIARSKIVAVLLGPTGVGMIGLYQSTIDLVQKATGFGINFSAVRDIAEAAGTNDQRRISRAIMILR